LDGVPDDDESLCCNAVSESVPSVRAGQALQGAVAVAAAMI